MNELIQGDCLEEIKKIPDGSVDLVLTDIPYDMVNRESAGLRNLDKGNADTFDSNLIPGMLDEFIRVCRGSLYVFCGFGQISPISLHLKNKKINPRLIVWEKTNPSPMNGTVTWLSGVEPCVFGKKPNATFNAHCRNTVLRYPSGRKNYGHPTEKNINLFSELIRVSSNEGDTVLDPFMGSGTTGVACKNLNRNFIGIELDKDYFEIAKKRIDNTDIQQSLLPTLNK